MYCYQCEESEDEKTKTHKTEQISKDPISQSAKQGSGFIKIKYLGN